MCDGLKVTAIDKKKSIDIIVPVKNGGPSLIDNISKWMNQTRPSGWEVYVYLVDDGSDDGFPLKIRDLYLNNNMIKVLHNEEPKGRASARNQGADAGSSEFLAFFDADCFPATLETISAFINIIDENNSKLMFGSLNSNSNSFWGQYFQQVSNRREKLFLSGDKAAFTTANCMIDRKLFYSAGKFDERYKMYGFEDKDLILRLIALHNTVSYVKKAQVVHSDALSLKAICNKMYIAGKYTSKIFKEDHPVAYKKMSFYQADMRDKKSIFVMIVNALKLIKKYILFLSNILLRLPLPYKFKANIVKYCSGLYFAVGTSESLQNKH